MMAFLLDTNVLSELRNPKRCDPQVKVWQQSVPVSECFLSAISLMEIQKGILQVRRKDERFSENLRLWLLNEVKPTFRKRVFPVSGEIAEEAGRILAMRSRCVEDGLIAATAKVLDLTLATRNTADFEDVGIRLVNPWD